MMEKILGTSGKISLLRAMLTGEKEPLSLNELARISGLSTSTAFREVKDLLGILVDYDPSVKKYRIMDTPLSAALRGIFELERETFKREGATIFDLLTELGPYYVSGASAIALRGLGRDFVASTDSLMIICDRRISKLRGAIMSLFPSYRLLLLEERVRPADFIEGEVYFAGSVMKSNLAVLEKAVVDALWRPSWGENIAYAIYFLLEQPFDIELLKKYARGKGARVEGRLREVLDRIGRATGTSYRLGDLGPGKGLEKNVAIKVEEALGRVLRG